MLIKIFIFIFSKTHSGHPMYRESFAPQNWAVSSTASAPSSWGLNRNTILGSTPDVWNRILILAQLTILVEENIPTQSF